MLLCQPYTVETILHLRLCFSVNMIYYTYIYIIYLMA